MRYYLIAGEPSGDLHGANLMRGLKLYDSECDFRFWGGDGMASEGGEENLSKHYRETSFFGFVEVVRNLRTISQQFKECRADIKSYNPDVLILIDYPGFNLKMARWAKRNDIRVYYYIAPKVWAWKESRIKLLKRYVDELFIIFPFEQEYFAQRGVRATFEGNPLVDALELRRGELPSVEEFKLKYNLDERPIVALLAGSRKSEIRANLPLMVALSREFSSYQFVVAGVSWLDKSLYEGCMEGSDIRYVDNVTYETLSVAEAAVVTSGTATLETALLNIPEVVVFRIPWWQVKLRPYFLSIPFISLVNLNLGRESVREILQSTLDVGEVSGALRSILKGGDRREVMLQDFDELRTIIGSAGASDRFARVMVERLKVEE